MTVVLCFRRGFYTPKPSFCFGRVNAPAVYHIPGTGKGLFQIKLVKVHAASVPCTLVKSRAVFWCDKHYATGFMVAEIYAVIRRSVGISIGQI